MAATATNRLTKKREGDKNTIPAAANAVGRGGVMMAVNAAGDAVEASADATLTVVGKLAEPFDNTGGAAGDVDAVIELSIGQRDYLYANDTAGTPVAQADILQDCFVKDNQTVTGDNTGTCVAGTVMGLTSDETGVWVRFKH